MAGSNIIITGAGRGLGRALALELAQPGRRLGLLARTAAELEETASLARARGAFVHAIPAEVGRLDQAPRIALELVDRLGPIDVLIHNASVLGPVPLALLADTAVKDFVQAFEVNVLGPFALTRAVLGSMLLRKGGRIVTISSDAAVNAYPSWGAYGASKAALDHLSKTLAAELEGTGVSVLAIDPGEMDTAMHQAAMPEADRAALARPAWVAARVVRLIDRGAAGRHQILAEEERR